GTSCGVPEAVAGPPHREYQLRVARVALDLLAEMPDVDVDRARLAVVGAPANALEELPPAEHHARLGGEQREQLELDERERDGLTPHLDGASRQVDDDLAAVDQVLPATCEMRVRGASQERPDPAPELADRKRLRDVVVGSELEPEHLVELVVARGEHDDRHRAVRAKPAADLEAVDLREHDVEHDEVDRLLGEAPQGLVAVARLDDPVAVALERVREQRLDRILVVDEEDGRGRIRHFVVGHARACTPARAYYSPLHGARPPRHDQAEAAARLRRA